MANRIDMGYEVYTGEIEYKGLTIRGDARNIPRSGKTVVQCFVFDLPKAYRERLNLPADATKLLIEVDTPKVRRISK